MSFGPMGGFGGKAILWAVALVLASTACAGEEPPSETERHDPSDAVAVVRDLPYARYGDRELRLDLYRPAEAPAGPIPAVVVIRGGGWRLGDKEGFAAVAERLAAGGLVAACVEYRTSEEATFPAALNDVKAAVRWLRTNAAVLGIDPRALGAIGGSAGGHLAAMLATTHRMDELDGDGGNPDASNRIQAAVAMAPVVDLRLPLGPAVEDSDGLSRAELFLGVGRDEDEALWALASPITHVHAGAAPMLLLHGDVDATVPYAQSEAMLERYREVGAVAELVTVPGAPHDFWNETRWFEGAMTRAVDFFQRTLGQR